MSKKEKTTIEISKETREQLKELGKKGETYDSIIRRLIESKKGEKANL